MRLLINFWALLSLCLSTTWAAEPQVLSVRIKSFICATREGISTSGVPIRFQGKNYILTSSWGVLEEPTGVCNEVYLPTGGAPHSAKLVHLNWGMGYALLESDIPGPDLETLTDALPSSVLLESHGFSPEGISEKKTARVVASKSTRHHLAGLNYSYEVISEPIQSSWVGAPLYGNRLEGIISGQWIQLVPGSSARIHEWENKESKMPNHLIVIPVARILESLKSGFLPAATFQAASTKLGDRLEISLGSYHFKFSCPEGVGEPPLDGIGPIGGSDGVGAGGPVKGAPSCVSEVTSIDGTLLLPTYFPVGMGKDLDTYLPQYETLFIPFLAYHNAGKHLVRVPVYNLPDFFNELAKNARLWVLTPKDFQVPTATDDYSSLVRESIQLRDLLVESYPIVSPREDDRKDYRFLYVLTTMAGSLNWKSMEKHDWSDMSQVPNPSDFVQGVYWHGEPLHFLIKAKIDRIAKLASNLGVGGIAPWFGWE